MEKVKVKVFNGTGASRMSGELCLSSGIIEYEDGFSHVIAMAIQGRKVEKVLDVKPEPVKEEVVTTPPPQSEKKKGKK